jgi:hypothetical protein
MVAGFRGREIVRSRLVICLVLVPLTALFVTPRAVADGSVVTYELDSNGQLSDISYSDGMNESQMVTTPSTPWSITFVSQVTTQLYVVGAQSNDTQMSCRIIVDGEVRVDETADGSPGVVMICDAVWSAAEQATAAALG